MKVRRRLWDGKMGCTSNCSSLVFFYLQYTMLSLEGKVGRNVDMGQFWSNEYSTDTRRF
jgi:hypothetical protein